MPRDKVILAYSGGLDTSVMVPWIREKYNLDVVAFTVDLGQDEEIKFAAKHGIPVEATKESPYSIDQNLWGRSCEAGVLEDPWDEPPEGAFACTTDPAKAPNDPEYVEIEFEHGQPIAVDGKKMDGVPLIERLNEMGGKHGVGRIDHVENRLVGIKSRELYEAPAAVILHQAHRELESLTLSKQAHRFKTMVSQEYADIIYNGLWFNALRQDLFAFVCSNQRFVSGLVRVKLYRGKAVVVGRKSEHSL